MTKRTGKKKAADALEVKAVKGEEPLKTVARLSLRPGVRHAQVAGSAAGYLFGDTNTPSIMDNTEVLAEILKSAKCGDKELSSQLLAAQAVTLDALFTELAMRSKQNMGQYFDAAERYMRLALRAQSNCRTTLEALARLHQPREQTVKHVQVNEGGQAVVADQFHQHRGEGQNAKSDEQSHATGTAGTGPAMLGADTEGNGVPISSGERSEAVQDARRDQSGRA
ncbi:hypothetical protein [Altererythrobacter sp. MF3-039]|uniref:hypothetical protein n=1 Tax=Altererythrobacter sp. MF3-039 TaxID=3252901 RepID=UPI00390C7964